MIRSALAFVLVFTSATLLAETILYRNGRIDKGRILEHTRDQIIYEVDGRRVVGLKADIVRILYTDEETERAKREAEAKLAEQKRQAELREMEQKRKREEDERRKQDQERERKERDRTEEERKTRGGQSSWEMTLAKAIALPGWAQYERGQPEAYAFFGGLAGAGLYYAFHRREYSDFRRDYSYMSSRILMAPPGHAAGILFSLDADNARRRLDRSTNRLNNAGNFLLAVFAVNAIDVLVFRPLGGSQVSFQSSPSQLQIKCAFAF